MNIESKNIITITISIIAIIATVFTYSSVQAKINTELEYINMELIKIIDKLDKQDEKLKELDIRMTKLER